jgi:hypothetical protein
MFSFIFDLDLVDRIVSFIKITHNETTYFYLVFLLNAVSAQTPQIDKTSKSQHNRLELGLMGGPNFLSKSGFDLLSMNMVDRFVNLFLIHFFCCI